MSTFMTASLHFISLVSINENRKVKLSHLTLDSKYIKTFVSVINLMLLYFESMVCFCSHCALCIRILYTNTFCGPECFRIISLFVS